MGLIEERDGFTLFSTFGSGVPGQTLSVWRPVTEAKLAIIFKVTLTDSQHSVVVQRRPINRILADELHATGFTSRGNDYELRFFFGDFERSPLPITTIPLGGSYEYTDDGVERSDSVTDEGDMRFFTVETRDRGSNRIGLPKDLRPFTGALPQRDLINAVVFSVYRD
jgi:hypothetical protein